MNTLETVTVKTKNGPVVINKSDFDKDIHELHNSKPRTKKKSPTKKEVKYLVAKRDDKFFIVDEEDQNVVSDSIASEGYDTEAQANGAIAVLTLQG